MKIKEKTAWEKVLIARNSNRPKAEDYIKNILLKRMKELSKKSQEDLVSQRYEKYRKVGGIL